MEQVKMEKYVAVVLFGETAARKYSDGDFTGLKECLENNDGQIVVREFNTAEEREAYFIGLEDADGWFANAVMDEKEIQEHPEILSIFNI